MQPSQYFQIRTYHVYRVLWFLADEEIHWSFSLHHGLRLTMPLRFVMAKRVATQLGRRSDGLSDGASFPGPTPWCLRCWWSFEVLYVFLQLINTSWKKIGGAFLDNYPCNFVNWNKNVSHYFMPLPVYNRPFPSCLLPLLQNESKCETFHMKIDLQLNELVIKTHFHMKGFALGLVLKQRQREHGNDLFISSPFNNQDSFLQLPSLHKYSRPQQRFIGLPIAQIKARTNRATLHGIF